MIVRPMAAMSEATTRDVRIRVHARYLPERSAPDRRRFFFAYHVEITNEGVEPVRLLSRHWVITDGAGRVQDVKGPGVVGEQPHLLPGQSFEYTSACPLATEVGTMRGTYQMVTDGGDRFEAVIQAFTLACPNLLN